jgi:magnesium transporter
MNRPNDALIDIEGGGRLYSEPSSLHSTHFSPQELRRRRTIALPVEEDVCFPTEDVSELGDEERRVPRDEQGERRRRRRRQWPDLSVLEEWSREEKEDRSGDLRVKKISEPMLVEGRLRPQYKLWQREEDDAPYRFTYFNEEFQSTIHAQTISELVQPGGSFRELFIPDPPELEDSDSDDEPEVDPSVNGNAASGFAGGNRGSGSHYEAHSANTHNGNGMVTITPLARPTAIEAFQTRVCQLSVRDVQDPPEMYRRRSQISPKSPSVMAHGQPSGWMCYPQQMRRCVSLPRRLVFTP